MIQSLQSAALTEADLKDYVEGSITTPLTFQCSQTLFKKFKKYCLEEAGGNKVLALEKLLDYIEIDKKTAMLMDRDEELFIEIQKLKDLILSMEKKGIDRQAPKFFGSNSEVIEKNE